MVTAKPVVKNKFWILKEDNQKIGTVEKNVSNDFTVRMYDQQADFKNIKTIKNHTNIVFEEVEKSKPKIEWQVSGFPTDCKPYNGVYNVVERLPLYTKKNKSKSWHAAGYYRILINGKNKLVYCPKYILLKRYPFVGPAKTRDGFVYK